MQPTAPAQKSNRTKFALIALIGPTALLIIVFFVYAIANWLFGPTAAPEPTSADEQLFSTTSAGVSILNSILFLAGAVGVLTWLPGIITGIILLSTKK